MLENVAISRIEPVSLHPISLDNDEPYATGNAWAKLSPDTKENLQKKLIQPLLARKISNYEKLKSFNPLILPELHANLIKDLSQYQNFNFLKGFPALRRYCSQLSDSFFLGPI